jgi:hypothetical protein
MSDVGGYIDLHIQRVSPEKLIPQAHHSQASCWSSDGTCGSLAERCGPRSWPEWITAIPKDGIPASWTWVFPPSRHCCQATDGAPRSRWIVSLVLHLWLALGRFFWMARRGLHCMYIGAHINMHNVSLWPTTRAALPERKPPGRGGWILRALIGHPRRLTRTNLPHSSFVSFDTAASPLSGSNSYGKGNAVDASMPQGHTYVCMRVVVRPRRVGDGRADTQVVYLASGRPFVTGLCC